MGSSHIESYALITGATSGIGTEFARTFAALGYSVVLSGRRENTLHSLAQEIHEQYAVEVEVITADLLSENDVSRLVNRIQQDSRPVEILVNNAGFGLGKNFLAATAQEHLRQVDVLAKVPLLLMHTALEKMVTRGRGRIINVASVAAYTPGGTYSAAKCFLLSASRSAHLQFASCGIDITVVCPGLTRSGFHRAMKTAEPQLPNFFWHQPQDVVQAALQANFRGKAEIIPSLTYRVMALASRALPQNLVGLAISRTRDY